MSMFNDNGNVKWWILSVISLFIGLLPAYIHTGWAWLIFPAVGSIGIIESLMRLK